MTRLEEIAKDIQKMPDDEVLARLMEIRQNRMKRPATEKATVSNKQKIASKISGMTPEQKAKLLKELGG